MGAFQIMPTSNWVQTAGAIAAAGATLLPSNLQVAGPSNLLPANPPIVTPADDRIAGLTRRGYSVDRGIIILTRNLARSKARWFNYVTRRLSELTSSTYGFNAVTPPMTAACERALHVAEDMFRLNTPTPSVVASEDGDVVFIWRSAALELEIEVGIEEIAVWAYDRPAGTVWSGQLGERQAEFFGLLDSIERV
jgi:hypothetical protein